ncbi:unnamed protein product, partial [Didymodactylos carnosus]
QELFKSRKSSMSSDTQSSVDQESQRRNSKSIKGLWTHAFKTIKSAHKDGSEKEETKLLGGDVIHCVLQRYNVRTSALLSHVTTLGRLIILQHTH